MSFSLFFDISLLQLMMVMMTPLLLACLGETLIEHSGILNLGIEGIVTVGAVTGFLGTFWTGSAVLGCLLAMVAGSILTSFVAYFAITLRTNQIILGLSIFVFGLGLSPFFYRLSVGVVSSPPQISTLPIIKTPLLGDIPFFGAAFFQQNPLVYTSYVLVAAMSVFLFQDTPGPPHPLVRGKPAGRGYLGDQCRVLALRRLRRGGHAVGPRRGLPPSRDSPGPLRTISSTDAVGSRSCWSSSAGGSRCGRFWARSCSPTWTPFSTRSARFRMSPGSSLPNFS